MKKILKRIEYYLQKSPDGKSYHARTLRHMRCGKGHLIEKMLRAEPELNEELIEKVFRAAGVGVEEILLEGNSLVIPGYATIRPVIKGSFKSEKEVYNPDKHPIVPSFSFSRKYLDTFKGKVRAKRVAQSFFNVDLFKVTNSRGEEDVLSHRLAAKIKGANLKERGMEFAGVELMSCLDMKIKMRVEFPELDLILHTGKEICINLGPYFQPPAWLQKEKRVNLGLLYKRKGSSYAQATSYITLTWQGDRDS